MQATTNLTRMGILSAVVAGCTAASLPVGPDTSSSAPEGNAVGRMALVSETLAEETTPTTGRANLQVRFVSAGSTDRSAQYLPKAVKQGGSLKVFVSAGGKTYSGDYGRNPISQVPFSAIDLYGSIPSPQTVTFTDLPPGPATVTAYAYDAAGGYGNTAAEASANVSLVSGNGNKVRLSFIRSGAPVLLGAYEQTGPSSTASVDAGPTGYDVTLNVTDILEPDVVGNIRIFVGGVEANSITNSLTDAGVGRIQ
ncbi:MAG: hypothetical protein EBU81_15125, partial [Proteobacteria bacterium]|nr:hypothetical protein [Pseudomonadota bacterium]